MPALSLEKREEVANRLNGGQAVKDIASDMSLTLKTIYRLKRVFEQIDGTFIAVAGRGTPRRAFSREDLVTISQWMVNAPKLTLKEIRERLVTDELYETIDEVPDSSTLYRHLVSIGFHWKRPIYTDPRAKRDVVTYERCLFRKAQDDGLDPTTLLSMDESFIFYEQATRSWGNIYSPAKLPKDKSVPRRALLCTVSFRRMNGINKGFLHWVLIPPRPTFAPLEPTIQQ